MSFAENLASVVGGSIMSGLVTGIVPDLTIREAIEANQQFETDLARLHSLLESYGCGSVRFGNDYGPSAIISCRFPEGLLACPVSRNLIQAPSVDWVEHIAQEVIATVQERRRQALNSLQEYYDTVLALGAVQVENSFYFSTLPGSGRVVLVATFPEGEIEQRIDPTRTNDSNYLFDLWQDMRYAYQMLVTGERRRIDLFTIESITINRRCGISIERDGTLYVGGTFSNVGPGWAAPINAPFTDKENFTAKELLLSCLTPKQAKQLEAINSFFVTGQSGELYQIVCTNAYNVIRQSDKARLCAGPADSVPTYDMMLAQKLLIENDEQLFLEKANIKGSVSVQGVAVETRVDTQDFLNGIRGFNDYVERIESQDYHCLGNLRVISDTCEQ